MASRANLKTIKKAQGITEKRIKWMIRERRRNTNESYASARSAILSWLSTYRLGA